MQVHQSNVRQSHATVTQSKIKNPYNKNSKIISSKSITFPSNNPIKKANYVSGDFFPPTCLHVAAFMYGIL